MISFRSIARSLRRVVEGVGQTQKAEQVAPSSEELQVAYLVLEFPKLSETFVMREIAGLRELGWRTPIYPLWSSNPDLIHPEVQPMLPLVRWRHPLSGATIIANLTMLRRRPQAYLATLWLIARQLPRDWLRAVKALALFPTMVWIAGDMKQHGVRHVHAHFASFPALAALVAHRLSGVSYSFTAHAFDLYVKPSMLSEKISAASMVVTISDYNRRLLSIASRASTPIHVVHCGVRVPEAVPQSDCATRSIACVARLEEKKGHRYLIEACRILRDRGVHYDCTIVGGGPLERDLRSRITEAGLDATVALAGQQTTDAVQRLLRRTAVFVLPSVVTPSGNAEGIPVALMEAMAAGVPVVSTRTTGIPELVRNGVTGLLVEPRDAVALADALQRLLDDPELREIVRTAAFHYVKKEFALESSIARMDELLRHATCVDSFEMSCPNDC